MYSAKTRITNVLQLRPGDHICHPTAAFGLFYHHAIVTAVKNFQSIYVVHLAGTSNGSSWLSGSMTIKSSTIIRIDNVGLNLSKFAYEGKLYRVDYENYEHLFSAEVVVQRAMSMIGQLGLGYRSYHLFKNNCEHFATWCKTGLGFSRQSGV